MLDKLLSLTAKNNRKENETNNTVMKLEKVSKVIPATDVLDFFNRLQETYEIHRQTEVEIRKIEAQRDVIITEITQRYELYHKVFDSIFDERKLAISKSFEVIDQGLKNNDRELVNTGMQGLSKVVSSSPFANVDQLAKMIQGDKIIEI
ncbi:hypothetical protein [Rummeliibacillus suwonensis]|uniref:hypothetical protein n=1 Tax=Rummeliibacillus suwonensis TaxID=1306154 RepID=UPI00289DD0B4|nr:hypothetical protein [Rummeliibacillus suwonensis]